MRDRWIVGCAIAAALGAIRPEPFLLVPALLALIGALMTRHPVLTVVAVAALASTLSARSHSGLRPPESQVRRGWVTLVADPEPFAGAIRVDVDGWSHRLDAAAHADPAAARLASLSAGERVLIRGRIHPIRHPDAWQVARHLVGRLEIEDVERVDRGVAVARAANAVRSLLVRGSEGLDPGARSLFLGLTLGDDRGQRDETAAQFRAAGLTHLLAVSGENVAFVLTVAGPALRRLGHGRRLIATWLVLGLFACVTRFEPSVLRATVMAGIACAGTATGRPGTPQRHLALAVAGLLLVDPLLVHSVGFRLSVAACAGIVVLSGRVARALPGPRWLTDPMAVTVAAQAGVAPVAIPVFGSLPVVALPANLLAAPVAGFVTAWGMSAGLVAGLIQPSATLLHLPTRLATWWVAAVARQAAAVPLGHLGKSSAVILLLSVSAVAAVRKRGLRPPV